MDYFDPKSYKKIWDTIGYYPSNPDLETIRILTREVVDWEQGWVWVTDKVKYNMRDVIMRCRRNYLGKYKEEYDSITQKKRIFIPLTEDMVETIVKNIDLDSADINIRATNPDGQTTATLLRYILQHYMRKNYFGEILNRAIRQFCIDGTVVLKTLKNYDEKQDRQAVESFMPDITNLYIDPTERNIFEAGAIIERNVFKTSEIKDKEKIWKNTKYLHGYQDLARVYRLSTIINPYGSQTQVPYAEIYERWGDLPLSAFEDEKELEKIYRVHPSYRDLSSDDMMKTWVPAIAIVSNLTRSPVVHAVKFNKDGMKPYEECRYREIFGRWHGRGVAEILLGLQTYINETINLRLQKARITSVGIFKIRKGSGLNQNIMNSLTSGGALPVTKMDDIEELPISDIKGSSYQDETSIYNWSQKAVGAFETGRGSLLPSSMPATTAVLQNQGQAAGFDLLQQQLGMFLSRVFERHIIPLLIETIKVGDLIDIIGDPKELSEIDQNRITTALNKVILDHWTQKKRMPQADYIEGLRKFYTDGIGKQSGRYFNIDNIDMFKKWKYQVEVFVTGESFNKAVMVQQLNALIQTYSQIPGSNIDTDAVFKEILDLMGMGGQRFLKSASTQQPQQPGQSVVSQGTNMRKGAGLNSQTDITAQANTQEPVGAAAA